MAPPTHPGPSLTLGMTRLATHAFKVEGPPASDGLRLGKNGGRVFVAAIEADGGLSERRGYSTGAGAPIQACGVSGNYESLPGPPGRERAR